MSPKGEHLRLMQLVHLAQTVRAHADRLVDQLVHGDTAVTRKNSIDRLTMTRLASTMLLCIYQFSSDAPSHLAVCYYKVRVQHGLEIRDTCLKSDVSGIGVSQPGPKLGKNRRPGSWLACKTVVQLREQEIK